MSGAGLPDIEIPDAEGMSVAIVTAHWNDDITGQLRDNAVAAATEAGAMVRDYTVVGALELPVVVQALADDHDDPLVNLSAGFGQELGGHFRDAVN